MTFARVFRAFSEVLSDIEERATQLLAEGDVRTAVELLPEWAAELGLAEDCDAGLPDTVAEIRFSAYVKLTLPGGQNAFHLSEVARILGYDVGLEDFEEVAPYVCGSSCGDPLYSDEWRFVVYVHAPVATPRFARTGLSVCGEPLCSFGNDLLECGLERVKPAHVLLLFVYDRPYIGYSPWNFIAPGPVALRLVVATPHRT